MNRRSLLDSITRILHRIKPATAVLQPYPRKHRTPWITQTALAALAGLAAAPAAHAQTSYSFRALGTLGGSTSTPYAVNRSLQVVGSSSLSTGAQHAFLWENGVMKDLGTLGGTSVARSINQAGDIVGNAQASGSDSLGHACIWQRNAAGTYVIQDLNLLLSPQDHAVYFLDAAAAINDSRQVTGEVVYTDPVTGVQSGFSYFLDLRTSPATLTVADPTGTGMSTGTALNNAAATQVVGCKSITSSSNPPASYLWDTTTNATTIIPQIPNPKAVSNLGEIVGYSSTAGVGPVYRSVQGIITQLGTFGAPGGEASAINNAASAMVVGYANLSKGSFSNPRAFRWRVGSGAKENLNNLTSNLGKWVLHKASGINDLGYIVGTATTNESTTPDQAYLLTPQ